MRAFNQSHLDNLEELARITAITAAANRESVLELRHDLEKLQASYSTSYDSDPHAAKRFPREHAKAVAAIEGAKKKLDMALTTGTALVRQSVAAKYAFRAANDFIAANKVKSSDEAADVDYPRPDETFASVEGAIATARANIADLNASIQKIRARPVAKSVALQRLNDAANRVRDNLARWDGVSAFISPSGHGAAEAFLVLRDGETSMAPMFSDAYVLNGALHSALHLDDSVAFYKDRIEKHYKTAGDAGLTDEERSAKIAEAKAKSAELEELEEALIRLAAREFGLTIDRRKDASGAALLGPLVDVADQQPAPPLVTANDRALDTPRRQAGLSTHIGLPRPELEQFNA